MKIIKLNSVVHRIDHRIIMHITDEDDDRRHRARENIILCEIDISIYFIFTYCMNE